jgi:hypothetical protein
VASWRHRESLDEFIMVVGFEIGAMYGVTRLRRKVLKVVYLIILISIDLR